MKEIITKIVMWCDLHGKGTEAVETLTIGLNGKEREIDVCAECSLILSEPFNQALAAGRKVTTKPQREITPRSSARRYRKMICEYADEHGIRNPRNPEQPGYMTSTGKSIWYSTELIERFEADHPEMAGAR